MKKMLMIIVFVFLATAIVSGAEEAKKILNLQKAYIYMPESLLISDSDLNCSYFIKDDISRDIRIVSSHVAEPERIDFSDMDELVIDKGSKDGLKEGDMFMIISEGQVVNHPRNHSRLGRYFLKKSLAQITCIYQENAVIQLQKGCNPVHIGDFVILYNPEKTVFEKKMDYKYCRPPTGAVSGMVVYSDLGLGYTGVIAGDNQYVSVDLGEGVVAKGSYLLFTRVLDSDLPPLIIGLGIVIHSEKTNSTVKILDAGTDIRIKDQVLVLRKEGQSAVVSQGEKENIPVVETVPQEGQELGQAVADQEAGQAGNVLNFDILFEFDSKQPLADHAADFAAIKDFVAAKTEYLVTLRGYTCSIGGEEYNLRLSSQRVETIKNILVSQYGIDAAHIETLFYGEKEPQYDNSSEAERHKNRLVKVEVNGK